MNIKKLQTDKTNNNPHRFFVNFDPFKVISFQFSPVKPAD